MLPQSMNMQKSSIANNYVSGLGRNELFNLATCNDSGSIVYLISEIHKETAAMETKYIKEMAFLLNNQVGAKVAQQAVEEDGVRMEEALSLGRAAEAALLVKKPTPPVEAGCVIRKMTRSGRRDVLCAEFHIFAKTNIDFLEEDDLEDEEKRFRALVLTLITVLTRLHTLKKYGPEPFQRANTSLCYASQQLSFLLKLSREDLLYVDCPVGPSLGSSSETFYTTVPLVSNDLDRACMEEAAKRRGPKMKYQQKQFQNTPEMKEKIKIEYDVHSDKNVVNNYRNYLVGKTVLGDFGEDGLVAGKISDVSFETGEEASKREDEYGSRSGNKNIESKSIGYRYPLKKGWKTFVDPNSTVRRQGGWNHWLEQMNYDTLPNPHFGKTVFYNDSVSQHYFAKLPAEAIDYEKKVQAIYVKWKGDGGEEWVDLPDRDLEILPPFTPPDVDPYSLPALLDSIRPSPERPEVETPLILKKAGTSLFPYQIRCLRWLLEKEGVLPDADRVGYSQSSISSSKSSSSSRVSSDLPLHPLVREVVLPDVEQPVYVYTPHSGGHSGGVTLSGSRVDALEQPYGGVLAVREYFIVFFPCFCC